MDLFTGQTGQFDGNDVGNQRGNVGAYMYGQWHFSYSYSHR